MKNKRALYVLLPLMIVIWGIIFYRIFSYVNKETINSIGNNDIKAAMIDSSSVVDTFSIVAKYRDPFLQTAYVNERKTMLTKPPAKPIEKVEAPPVIWPSIHYGGMVKNQQSNKAFALVRINEKDNLMKPGDELQGVKLMNMSKDSIEVIYQQQKKTVLK